MKIEEMFYIPEEDWYKLQGWAKLAYDKDKNEISGLLTAVPDKDGRYKLSDVEILKQENSGTNTELDADSVAEYKMKYAMKYNNAKMKFVWWHSHHTMEAFWSGTDIKEIEAWENTSFSLALVINLKEEYKFRVSIWNANGIPIDKHYDTVLTIERETSKINITKAMEKEYEELCSERNVIQHNYGTVWKRNGNVVTNYNPYQMQIGDREDALNLESYYTQALEKAEEIQDDMVAGTITLKDYRKEVKKFNKACKDKKMPFSFKQIKGNTHEVMSKLMTTMPNELFDWDDNRLKDQCETIAWKHQFGGGGWNNGY
jgi:proteasome lid subunit RPN8/RPN11